MQLSDFDFLLPQELIAQKPHLPRDECRLMVLDRTTSQIEDKKFFEITDYFSPGDVLVLNNTRVIPARLFARREGKVEEKPIEIFLLKEISSGVWQILGRPAKKLKKATRLIFSEAVPAEISEVLAGCERLIKFEKKINVLKLAQKIGQVPLPPYIKPAPEEIKNLAPLYQTVFAKNLGATASPTAGLHFTQKLLRKLTQKGVKIFYLTLHTGFGTFKPIREEDFTRHQMDPEFCQIRGRVAAEINQAKEKNKKIFAVGTTSARALEGAADASKKIKEFQGETNLFIYPGFKFKIVDALITNFHLPKSSLILLASAFAGPEFLKNGYAEAIEKRYRFFSFGDAMLIL